MNVPPRSRGSATAQAERSFVVRQVLLPAQAFIHAQVVGGIVLFAAAMAAVVWANSPWDESYFDLWEKVITLDVGIFSIEEDLRHWINDGLMVLFFFLVALEIKRELVHGEISEPRRAALPVAAALGGMTVPALVYLGFNFGGDGERGWGIPMATDTAFALGVLAMLGKRLPAEVRVFLLGVAIVDDIAAILVIALFYTDSVSFQALGIAALLLGVIVAMNRGGVLSMAPYFVVGALIWVAVLKSGIHATIAGVALGLLAPASPHYTKTTFAESAERLLARFRAAMAKEDDAEAETVLGQIEELAVGVEAPVERLERLLEPWVSYAVVPLFALANAGIDMSGGALGDAVASPVAQGIVIGLVVGKPIGVVAFSWLAVRSGLAKLPRAMTWSHVVGLGLVAGIGFTVSIFITGLAFSSGDLFSDAKIGILAASVLAGAAGFAWLRVARPK